MFCGFQFSIDSIDAFFVYLISFLLIRLALFFMYATGHTYAIRYIDNETTSPHYDSFKFRNFTLIWNICYISNSHKVRFYCEFGLVCTIFVYFKRVINIQPGGITSTYQSGSSSSFNRQTILSIVILCKLLIPIPCLFSSA